MSAAAERAFPQLISQVFPPLLKTTDVAPLDRSQHRRVNRKFLAVKEAPEPVEECSWVFFEGMGRARVHNAAHPRYGLLLGLSPVGQDGACDRCNIIASTCQIDDC